MVLLRTKAAISKAKHLFKEVKHSFAHTAYYHSILMNFLAYSREESSSMRHLWMLLTIQSTAILSINKEYRLPMYPRIMILRLF